MATKKRPTEHLRTQAMAAATEAVRRRLELETLDTRGRDTLDFHDLSVASIRDAIELAFNAGFAAASGISETRMYDPKDSIAMMESLKITEQSRRKTAGTWVRGTIAGHTFEALVFPQHADTAAHELGESRISKLHVREQASSAEVACFDRGWDREPTTESAKAIVDLLAAGLAELAFGT